MPSSQIGRPYQDESVVRTDEQQDPATRYTTSEKSLDPAHPPVAGDPQGDALGAEGQPKQTTRHTEVTRTDESEQPQQAVRNSYTDS